MFDPVVGQIMRIYGYFVMKKLGSQRDINFETFSGIFSKLSIVTSNRRNMSYGLCSEQDH